MQPALESEYGSALVGALRRADFSASVGRLRFRLAESFGFCYGVDRAVEYACEARSSDDFDPDEDLTHVGFANQTTMVATESLAIGEEIRKAMADRYGAEAEVPAGDGA